MQPETNQSGLIPNQSATPKIGTAIDVVVKPTQKKETSMNTFLDDALATEGRVTQNLPIISQTVDDLVKPGWRTSEWWTTIAVDITSLSGGVLPANSRWVKVSALAVITITTVVYIISRTHVKKAAISSVPGKS